MLFRSVVGRVVNEDADGLFVMSNPFLPEQIVHIAKIEVKARASYPVSMMPPGLINALNEDELKNLLAFLLSGGNSADPMFGAAK